MREDNPNNLEKCCAASEATSITLRLAKVKAAIKLSKKGGKKKKYLNPILSACETPVQAPVVATETRSSENVLQGELASMQKQLDAALPTIAQLSKETCVAEDQ